MKTLILPGYSPSNLEWALEITKKVKLDHLISIHEWEHWKGGTMSVKREIEKIIERTKNDKKINFIAKSVGTRMLMHLTPLLKDRINKIILCGIPTKLDSEKAMTLYKNGLSQIPSTNILVIQNTDDPFASAKLIIKQIHSINPKIKFIEKTRSDHNYPHYQKMQKFLQ